MYLTYIFMLHILSNTPVQPRAPPQRSTHNLQHQHQPNQSDCGQCEIYFQIARSGIVKVVSSIFKRKKIGLIIFIFIGIHVARFIAGVVKITSDCPDEKYVAVFLLVKSLFGLLVWITLAVLGCVEKLKDAMENLFVEISLDVESLFSLIWLIIGSKWTFGARNDMIDECPFRVDDWDYHFINFAAFLVGLDWFCVLVFVLYCGYVYWDRTEVQPTV
ncbi:uncharacterized protein LOC132720518 [Ruditapes philippinarum]|uniref:uncharacterized protein LOC132720518 n=1 Tax=Ruditapes philippinarum TaxID=129788 RepID=UPI00295A7894|nr:uncharacterized protein LOC132720518 [Ruditapes philippinarum]